MVTETVSESLTCLAFHSSKETDRTKEIWTPRLRWIPLHLMQMNTPKLADAQRGPKGYKMRLGIEFGTEGILSGKMRLRCSFSNNHGELYEPFAPQSAQNWFSGLFTSSATIFLFLSGFSCENYMVKNLGNWARNVEKSSATYPRHPAQCKCFVIIVLRKGIGLLNGLFRLPDTKPTSCCVIDD